MDTIFWRQFKDRKWALLLYIVGAIAFLWIMVALYPSISKDADKFNELLKSLPQNFLRAFDVQQNSLSTFEGFVGLRYYSLVWPIMLVLMCISFAGRALAREVEAGTAELLLAKPVSRLRVYFSKYLFGLFAVAVFTALSVLAVWPLANVYNVSFVFERYLLLAVLAVLYGAAVYSLSLMVSAIFSEQSKVSMIIGGLLVLMYFINIVAAVKESLSDLKYGSFFYYFDYSKVLNHGQVNFGSVWVFGAIIVASTIIGAIVWWRRDV